MLDVGGAILGLLLLAPLLCAVGLLVCVFLGRPVLFKQVRAGKAGRPFTEKGGESREEKTEKK